MHRILATLESYRVVPYFRNCGVSHFGQFHNYHAVDIPTHHGLPDQAISNVNCILYHNCAIDNKHGCLTVNANVRLDHVSVVLSANSVHNLYRLYHHVIAIHRNSFLINASVNENHAIDCLRATYSFVTSKFRLVFYDHPTYLMNNLSSYPVLVLRSNSMILIIHPLLTGFSVTYLGKIAYHGNVGVDSILL